ncbi:MAG: hypothetical protein ILP19_08255, partial [Oscillospiraceae bacterium]|nr:hypothetical protein [Oscillospiraceae bacterium]
VFISCGKQISDPVEDDFRKITVCGTEFSIPFTAADLTGDFSYRENSGRLDILHKGKVIGEITYTDGLSDYTDAIPAAVTFNEDADFTIGSFSEGMKLYELRECLGKPTEQLVYPGEGFGTESYYVFRDMMIDFRNTKIDKSQKVDYVCFYLDVDDGHHGHYEKKGSFDNVNHILLGDKEISLPFTIESLGDGYSNDAWSILKGGEIVGRYNDKTKDGDMIYGFCITNSESSSINGISMASTKNDIAAVLGEPTIKGAPQYPSSENEYLASFTCDTYYYEGGEIHIYYSDENIREIEIDMYHWQ